LLELVFQLIRYLLAVSKALLRGFQRVLRGGKLLVQKAYKPQRYNQGSNEDNISHEPGKKAKRNVMLSKAEASCLQQ
jgi:hypothetical protein